MQKPNMSESSMSESIMSESTGSYEEGGVRDEFSDLSYAGELFQSPDAWSKARGLYRLDKYSEEALRAMEEACNQRPVHTSTRGIIFELLDAEYAKIKNVSPTTFVRNLKEEDKLFDLLISHTHRMKPPRNVCAGDATMYYSKVVPYVVATRIRLAHEKSTLNQYVYQWRSRMNKNAQYKALEQREQQYTRRVDDLIYILRDLTRTDK